MTRYRLLAAMAAWSLVACGGSIASRLLGDGGPPAPGGSAPDGAPSPSSSAVVIAPNVALPPPATHQRVDKLDLLFMIDNSASMGDKQELLALAVPDMIARLVQPRCLDASQQPTGQVSDPSGNCPAGSTVEFAPVHDMHIGIVTSSLGGRGGDVCNPATMNPANASLNAHQDDRGELINRGGAQENIVPNAQTSHFLSWFPPVSSNAGQPTPPTPAIGAVGSAGTPGTLVGDFTQMIEGVHEHGCGFEAQNEAWYRFLVQPDPFDTVNTFVKIGNTQKATVQGVDATILQQRHDFLRPDSLVAVIVVTDENEEVADPEAINGQGYAFDTMSFPGSANGQAPQGTIECAQPVDPANPTTTGPYSPNCTSCAYIAHDSAFAGRCPKDGTAGVNGFLDPANDALNVRFFQQKRRFGISVEYPVSRYVRGLALPAVPDRSHEHGSTGDYTGELDANANCVNPLFAASLPTSPSQELCALPHGPRTRDLIYYAAIAGVPHQLLQVDPTNPDSPQKGTLSPTDWLRITGKDPEHYDFTGADFHMIESELPRTAGNLPPGVVNASSCNVSSADNCDPVNGREWITNKEDLQFACIFPLAAPKECGQPQYAGACDCENDTMYTSLNIGTQLCDRNTPTTQVNGKAYPSVREMVIAHQMGTQGIVSSLCPIHMTEAAPGDPLYGYRPAVTALMDRIQSSIKR